MLVRFRYSGRSSVSHYCLTRYYLSVLHVCLQPCLLVKEFEPLKSREQQICGFYGAQGCRVMFIGRGVSASEPLSNSPFHQRQVAARAQAEGAACI